MRSRRILLVCAALGVLVVAAAGLEGTARFSGIRWVPNWTMPTSTLPPQLRRPLPQQTQPPLGQHTANPGTDLTGILLWVAIGLAVVAAALLIWRWLRRRPPRSGFGLREVGALTAPPPEPIPEPAPEPEPEAPVLRRGVEEALRSLEVEREPSDAVMKAWLGLQLTAEESGILRRAAETPTEFTSRIMSRVSADDRAIRTLLSLYLRTRFGDHPITSADVARAREALEGLAGSWDDRATAGGGSPSRPPRGPRAPGQTGWPTS